MNRQTRRFSRALIVILMVSVALGSLSMAYKLNRGIHTDAAPSPGPIAVQADGAATQPAQAALRPALPPMIDPPPPAAEPAAFSAGPTTIPTAATPTLLSDAQAKIDAGKLLEARQQLNDALKDGNLPPAEQASVKAAISQLSQSVVFSRRHFADDPYGGTYVVQSGDSLTKIAAAHDTTWELLGRINGIDAQHLRAGATIKVIEGPFYAVVDKHAFTMDIYLGGLPGEKSSMYVTTYPVGLGRDDSTPTGTWIVQPHRKLKHPTYYSPRGEGVIAADDPKNPLGGYWIGLTGMAGQAIGQLSYGIHGTNDPDSIGKQSSLGCIRMKAEDVAVVFDLMVEGKSLVQVKG